MSDKLSSVWLWRQLMRLAIITIGLLPLVSAQLVPPENRFIIFLLAGAILIVGALGEIWKPKGAQKPQDVSSVMRIQILLHFFLLTIFLQLYSHINGPLFLLYLPIIMEAFLVKEIFLGNTITLAMLFIVGFEYAWLHFQGDISGLFSYLEFMMRILSLVFIRAYGLLLAKEISAEEIHRREAEEKAAALAKANRRLEKLAHLKDEFLSVASHQLRSPATTVKGYLSMLIDGDIGKLPPEAKEYLGRAYESNEEMIRLVNNMLNLSQIESGRLSVGIKEVDITSVTGPVVDNFRFDAGKKGLQLDYRRPKESLPKVKVDPALLKEVLANLVSNAINFTPQGSITVSHQIKNGQIITAVRDTGVGISLANQSRLFEKFSPLDGAQKPVRKGSGLGLYICRMLLNELGGKIWLVSRPGKGSTFYFSLPVLPAGKTA